MAQKITVLYKSGAKVTIKCESFTCFRRGGELTKIEWDSPQPKPLFIGVDNIAAVYEGKA